MWDVVGNQCDSLAGNDNGLRRRLTAVLTHQRAVERRGFPLRKQVTRQRSLEIDWRSCDRDERL